MTTPFSVIGGFLGSGKTSFINALLAQPQGVRYGVLVNDFGDLAIDEALLSGTGRDVLSLANGCACCSIGNDLAAAIGQLQALNMDHIVLECSGVAIPARIADLAKLAQGLTPKATITLINANGLAALLKDKWMADTYVKQLQSGGQLLVNRLSGAVNLPTVVPLLHRHGICQPVQDQALYEPAKWLNHTDDGCGDTPDSHNLQQLSSRILQAHNLAVAKTWANQAAAASGIYRMKGFVRDQQALWLVQVVGSEVVIEPVAQPMGTNTLGLVLIGTKQALGLFTA